MIAERPRRPIGVLGPVLLIGIGAIALLMTSGALPSDAAGRLLGLWPLAFVLLGVQLIVVHLLPGRAGALVALVAMLSVVALGVGLVLAVPASAPASYRATAPISGVTAATLRLDAGRGTVHVSGRDLAEDLYDVGYRANGQPAVDLSGGTVHVSAPRSASGLSWLDPASDVTVALSSRVPWAVTINGAGLGGQVDLAGLDVSSVTVNGAGCTLDVRLPVGTGASVPVTVNGAGMNVTVRVPAAAGAHAAVAGVANRLDVNGAAVTGSSWTNPGSEAGASRYEIRTAGVGNHVQVEVVS